MMLQQLEAYQHLLQDLVNLQQQLIRAFEGVVEVIPPPPTFRELYGTKLDHIDWAHTPISTILHAWPGPAVPFMLALFVKHRIGVLSLRRQNWLFTIHGSDEVLFINLSDTVDVDILDQLRHGKTDAFIGAPVSYYGHQGDVEVTYLHAGRCDGVNSWSVAVFARSIDSLFQQYSEEEHQSLLDGLVDRGILLPWPDLRGQHRHFIFASSCI